MENTYYREWLETHGLLEKERNENTKLRDEISKLRLEIIELKTNDIKKITK